MVTYSLYTFILRTIVTSLVGYIGPIYFEERCVKVSVLLCMNKNVNVFRRQSGFWVKLQIEEDILCNGLKRISSEILHTMDGNIDPDSSGFLFAQYVAGRDTK